MCLISRPEGRGFTVRWITNGEEAEWKKIEDVVPFMRQKSNLPLGYIFSWPFQSGLDGTIPANGDTFSREEYSELWEYLLQHPDWMKTENEWSSIASSSNGYVPYYSSGDGTTTFRTPKFAPYVCLNGTPGMYYEAGLPNLTGEQHPFRSNWGNTGTRTGVFTKSKTGGQPSEHLMLQPTTTQQTDKCTARIIFDASDSNPIYGNSDTVTPESHVWNVFIVAQ